MTVPETYGGKVKIICVTETMFDCDIERAEINVPNFTPFRKDRQNGKEGGGSCIYVHESIRATELKSFDCNDSVAVFVETDPYPFVLVCVYRSQSLSVEDNYNIIEQINKIDIKEGHEMVVLGDFNLPNVAWNTGTVNCPLGSKNKLFILQKDFLDMFHYNNLTWLMDDSYITRRRIVSGTLQESLLDQILVSNVDISRDLKIVSPLGKSDHMGILFEVKCSNNSDTITKVKDNWGKFSNADILTLGINIDWNYSSDELSPNEMCSELESKLMSISSESPKLTQKCFPNGTIISKAPWDCTALKRKRREKDKFWAVFHEEPTKLNLNLAMSKQSEYESKLSQTLVKYEKRITGNMKHNPKQFFKYLNSKRKIKSGVSELKNEKGEIIESVHENANILGNFFASTFVCESSEHFNDINFTKKYTDNEIGDIDFDNEEIRTLLSEINVCKSQGPDDVHPKLIKTLSENGEFVDAVTKLFKQCYETGMLPDIWKTAKVTAIHKKGLKCDAQNYRPISLTCILCKVFEKTIRSHVLKHFEPFIHSSQHGFLNGKSCLSNLLNCFDKIDELLANDTDIDILYLDFQKAFDTVPHKLLIYKLEMYGIKGKTLKVISDFLSDRTFRVRIGDTLSDIFKVLSGVPQGSVLGPLLFLIYINDIQEGIRSFMLLFADDLKLVVNANLPNVTQNDLNLLNDWQKKWLLSFNTSDKKCKVLEVNRKNRCAFNHYSLNNSTLPIVESEKDLGINIVSDLNWNNHISGSICKAKKCIGWVTRSIISRDRHVMLNIYKSLIRPNLEYCVQLWNPIPKHGNWATIMEIESVQRKFTRLIDGIGLLPYEERLSNLQLTTLIERRARGDIIEVFKIFRGLCNYGKNLFKFSRSGMKIVLTKSTSSVNTFQMRVVGYWNRIPDNVKMAENVADFKHKLEVYKSNFFDTKGNYWELSEEIFNRIYDTNRQQYVDYMTDNPYIAKRKFVNVKM